MIDFYPMFQALIPELSEAAETARNNSDDFPYYSDAREAYLRLSEEAEALAEHVRTVSKDGSLTVETCEGIGERASDMMERIGMPDPHSHWDHVQDGPSFSDGDVYGRVDWVRQCLAIGDGVDPECIIPLGEDDWTVVTGGALSLGEEHVDYSVTPVPGSDWATVWAAGVDVWSGPIPGLRAEAARHS